VHAPSGDKSDDTKDSLYEELEHVFDQFLKYHVKILFRDFSSDVRSKDISRQHLGMRVYMKLIMIMGFE
jgi:hypothetical protein